MKEKTAGGYRLILGYLGIFLILVGIICLLPLLMLIAYPNEYECWPSFVIPGAFAIVCGIGLSFLIFKRDKIQLGKFQDSILLVCIWLIAIFVGSVPFLLRGMGTNSFNELRMNFTDAIFESTSGYTACGLTVFNFDKNAIGYHVFTTYRSLLLFFGGIGLVLVVTSTISDRYGLKLYTAEGHNDKLMPNLAKSARMILLIYVGYIILGTLSYWLIGGMEIFDSFNHAIAAVATGGFSTYKNGIPEIISNGGNNSITGMPINGIAINITSCVLMILGATNFVIHLFIFQGKFKKLYKDCELRFFALLCIIFVPLFAISILTSSNNSLSFWDAVGEGTFNFISHLSTTGFSSATPIKSLGGGALFLGIICMIIGGGMGSTGGAIKQYRLVVAFKSFYWSIRDRLSPKIMVHPHNIYRLGNEREVNKDETFEAYGYIVLYLVVLCFGSLLILFLSNDSIYSSADCFYEFASALSGTGLSVGITNDNSLFNIMGIRWVLSVGMFAGRLEIICIYFAFYRTIRDIFRKETV